MVSTIFSCTSTRRVLATSLRLVVPRGKPPRSVISVKYQDFTREHWPIRYKYIRFHENVSPDIIQARFLAICGGHGHLNEPHPTRR